MVLIWRFRGHVGDYGGVTPVNYVPRGRSDVASFEILRVS
jgi:hypothetical protein